MRILAALVFVFLFAAAAYAQYTGSKGEKGYAGGGLVTVKQALTLADDVKTISKI